MKSLDKWLISLGQITGSLGEMTRISSSYLEFGSKSEIKTRLVELCRIKSHTQLGISLCTCVEDTLI